MTLRAVRWVGGQILHLLEARLLWFWKTSILKANTSTWVRKEQVVFSICWEPDRLAQMHADGPSLWIAWDETPNEFCCLNSAALCVVCRPPTSLAAAAGGDRHQLPPEAECVGLQPAFGSAAVTKRRTQPGSLFCFAHYENQNVSCLERLSFLRDRQCANVYIDWSMLKWGF